MIKSPNPRVQESHILRADRLNAAGRLSGGSGHLGDAALPGGPSPCLMRGDEAHLDKRPRRYFFLAVRFRYSFTALEVSGQLASSEARLRLNFGRCRLLRMRL